MPEANVEYTEVQLPSGRSILLQAQDLRATGPSRPRDVGFEGINFEDLLAVTKEIASLTKDALDNARPSEIEMEIGLQIDAKSGKVAALLGEVGGNSSFKIKLVWKRQTSEHKP